MHARRAGLYRVAGTADRRQWLVVDLDRVGGVFGEIAVVGDDDRDRLADVTNLIARQ